MHALSGGLSTAARQLFPNTLVTGFDMVESFGTMQNAKKVLQASIRQHAQMCLENASSRTEALELVAALQPDVEHRVKDYVKLLGKATKSYREWLMEDYNRRLEGMVKRLAPVAKVA
ncbi:MAG: hypothetical protein EOO68_36010 [Moraxellaceae bacterium]|nr:MAG: hypothetical protein EOO68_36010 [Moraxellaceae bacterium]